MMSSDEMLVLTELSYKEATLEQLQERIERRIHFMPPDMQTILKPLINSAVTVLDTKGFVKWDEREHRRGPKVYQIDKDGQRMLDLMRRILE